eukprot:scaffold239153_cov17-Tisochrysis_lutea.AAC.1
MQALHSRKQLLVQPCVSLLTLYTHNTHKFRERGSGLKVNASGNTAESSCSCSRVRCSSHTVNSSGAQPAVRLRMRGD